MSMLDSDPLAACIQAAADGLRPDPAMTVSEWAERYRHLSSKDAGEPGPWRNATTPYLVEIMDCLSPVSPIERVIFMKAAQTGGTETLNNALGFIIHHAPGPALVVQPTVELAKRWSKQRFDAVIESTPVLRERVQEPRARDSGNTILSKEFPGGIAVITGANSAVGVRSMPVRFLFLDEVDAYPWDADGEGDPVQLAIQRTITFRFRKICIVSTPTIKGLSRVEAQYEDSDRRRFWVPCPECGVHQVLEEPRLVWPKGKPEEAVYKCIHCEADIPTYRKPWMLTRGEWRAENPGAQGGRVAGFHLSGLYSPWLSWADIAHRKMAATDSSAMKVYVNTIVAQTWVEKGDAPEWLSLYDRREDYKIGTVPMGGVVLTAGVDTQKDRLELEITAWGIGAESWSVDYRVLPGDPGRPEVWKDLDKLLDETFPHESGAYLQIARLAIDTGGHHTEQVYAWARKHRTSRVLAIKGAHDNLQAFIGQPRRIDISVNGRRMRAGVLLWPVGSSYAKADLYDRLRLEKPTDEALEAGEPFPPGYCHFPKYPEEYFKQLTAEHLVTVTVRGYPRRQWHKLRDRNESLDCRVYSRAAAAQLGIDRWSEQKWRAEARKLGISFEQQRLPAVKGSATEQATPTTTPEPSAPPGRRQGGWLGGRTRNWLGR